MLRMILAIQAGRSRLCLWLGRFFELQVIVPAGSLSSVSICKNVIW
jgi:hypothetical protein